MHDLVVRERQDKAFRIKIRHRERDVVVVVLAVDRIALQILERVVHPAQIPLVVEAQTAIQRRFRHVWKIGRVLRDEHDFAMVFLVDHEVGALHEVAGALVDAALFVSLPENRVRDRVPAQSVHVVDIEPVVGRRHQKRNGLPLSTSQSSRFPTRNWRRPDFGIRKAACRQSAPARSYPSRNAPARNP